LEEGKSMDILNRVSMAANAGKGSSAPGGIEEQVDALIQDPHVRSGCLTVLRKADDTVQAQKVKGQQLDSGLLADRFQMRWAGKIRRLPSGGLRCIQ
jgi:hypothetical protein